MTKLENAVPEQDRKKNDYFGEGSSAVADALRTAANHFNFTVNFNNMISRLSPTNKQEENIGIKELKAYRRLLSTNESYKILVVIWKESPYVTELALNSIGMKKFFDKENLNVFSLARAIAVDVDHLAAANTRVREICIAAEAFGLVDIKRVNKNKYPIAGTKELHEFMLKLADMQSIRDLHSTSG